MRTRSYTYYTADFETTVFPGQEYTEVWSAAIVELGGSEDVKVFHSIADFFQFLRSLPGNQCVYFHNLKFDGEFILSYLIDVLKYQKAADRVGSEDYEIKWKKEAEMPNETYKCSISDRGQWYTIIVRTRYKIIEFRDSLKLLPFSVKQIGQAFKTKHKKLEMVYTGRRYAGCKISDEEMAYIKNDVLVMREALDFMRDQGHTSLTIGACCMQEFREIYAKKLYEEFFPNMYNVALDKSVYGESNAGDYIRHAYKGGWCYLKRGCENVVYNHGVTADVNSLYPSVMHSESGNRYPVKMPTFWSGNYIPEEAMAEHRYFYVRIKTRFYVRDGYLPFIQIKGSWLYRGTECLESSDLVNRKTGEKSAYYRDLSGNVCDTRQTLTLTCTDYFLILEHYNLIDFEILDGCYFDAIPAIFDRYINKYAEIKKNSKGAMRTLAKLFLNNLYGKMAANIDSSFRVPFLNPDGSLTFLTMEEFDKKPGYIPIGAAITSYARNFTIRHAQNNYDRFIYADTDSLHLFGTADQVKGLKVHLVNFNCWKLESTWDYGLFIRQKTYIEHVVEEDQEPIEQPYYNLKCAGMSEHCKNLFLESCGIPSLSENEKMNLDNDEKEFLKKKRTINDLRCGLKVPGKLRPKHIAGGVVLESTTYELREVK